MAVFVALAFFSLASVGFLVFLLRYPRGSATRMWGIRICYLLGFFGVAMMMMSSGYFSEPSMMILAALAMSLITFELATRYLD